MNRILVLFLVIGLLIAGCGKRPAAVVNGEEISMEDFERQLAQRREAHRLQGAEVDERALREAVIQEMIGRRLLLQVAREKGITVSDEELQERINRIENTIGKENLAKNLQQWGVTEEQYRKNLRETIMIEKLINQLVPEDSITEEDMKKYYRESQTPFLKPERVQVRLLQTKTEQQARDIYEEWKKSGLNFDEFVAKMKQPEGVAVTGYGWIEPDLFGGVIRDALKELKEGEVGGPYKGTDGYYIIRVKKREPEKVLSYEEAKEQIKNRMLIDRRLAMRAHLIEERKKKSEIKVFVE